MRASLVKLVTVVGPMRELLEGLLVGIKYNKQVANNRVLREEDWTTEHAAAWMTAKNTLQSTVILA